MKMPPVYLLTITVICLTLNACTTAEEPPAGSNISGAVISPEPPTRMEQQIATQEAINRVNRSLSPF